MKKTRKSLPTNFDPHDSNNMQELKNTLDSKGPGFCLAKWTQVTTHLGSGITHSCHHVGAHKIKLNEIEKDPGALHNTEFKKERRREMLNGQRPVECDYCWRIEDNSDHFSDRVTKSISSWSYPYLNDIINTDGTENVYPKYVEVSFSNVCNFKCAYCGPAFSSKWTEEVKEKGTYEFTDYKGNKREFGFIDPNEVQYLEREHNPYIEAFWKWFPEAVKHMHVFRITGGEPLLSKHTMTVIDYLLENPQPNLEFAINTNACPPDKIWKEFIKKINKLNKQRAIKNLTLYTSSESHDKQNDYTRYGMNYNLWLKNIESIILHTANVKLSIMCAVNLLSVESLYKLIHDINVLRESIYRHKLLEKDITMDFAYVRNPKFLDIRLAPRELLDECFNRAIDMVPDSRPIERKKLRRIYDSVVHLQDIADEKELELTRYNFMEFIYEYDKRKQTNFNETFPLLSKHANGWVFVNV